MEIHVNKVVSDFDSGAKYLVLWVAPGNECGYWYDLAGSARTPRRFFLADLIDAEMKGRYEISDFVPDGARDENTLTDTERNARDRIWNIMQSVVEYEPDIYDAKTRGIMLKIITEEHGIAKSNLYGYLDKYWRSGKTKNAFIPKYQNRGGKGVSRYSDNKAGRKATGTALGKAITTKDHASFEAAIKKYYLNRNKLSLKDVYEKMLADSYAKPRLDKSELIELLPASEIPSLRQFRYWYATKRNAVTEQKKREGERSFELTGRSITGKSDYGLMGPGAQFQLDATVGDIYLVSQFDRGNLIGRPVIYFIIDVFSRMVTGMSIGLEGPSWASAMTALVNMATDKVAYCKEFGIDIDENEWPCRHVPSSLLGDRGEMESRNADNLVNMLGIRIINAPPYRADLKGVVEQYFHTINTKTAALLPGSVKPDMAKRGGHDYRLDAMLDIRQFTEIVIKCVLHYNKYHYMDYFEKSPAMISDQVEAIPIKLWDWGVRNISGALRYFPEELVRLAVMPSAKGAVTERGIRFKGLFYICDRAAQELWFEKARANRSWQVDVLYDSRDMANIYVRNQGDTDYELCYLLDWNCKNAGKCLDEIIYEQRKERATGRLLKTAETQAKVNLNAEIEAIVAAGQDLGKELSAKSKRARVSNIKENRRDERETMRSKSNESSGVNTAQNENQPVRRADEELSPRLRMIKAKAEEKIKND